MVYAFLLFLFFLFLPKRDGAQITRRGGERVVQRVQSKSTGQQQRGQSELTAEETEERR